MGLGHSAIRVLLKENNRRELGGSILSLGRQDVFVTQPYRKRQWYENNCAYQSRGDRLRYQPL